MQGGEGPRTEAAERVQLDGLLTWTVLLIVAPPGAIRITESLAAQAG